MKKFHKYKLSQNDKQLIKNFTINDEWKTITQEEQNNLWKKILQTSKESALKELYSKLRWMQSYKTNIYENEYYI